MTTERRGRWGGVGLALGVVTAVAGVGGFLALSGTGATAGESTVDQTTTTAPATADAPSAARQAPLPSRPPQPSVDPGDSVEVTPDPTPDGPAAESQPADRPATVSDATTGRFVSLPGPIEILRTTTSPSTGNAAGFTVEDLAGRASGQIEGWSGERIVSILADVTVSGDAPGSVLFHPGNRPDEALRLRLSNSGQLRASYLLLRPDDQGRVVIAADPKGPSDSLTNSVAAGLEVTVTARAVYVESDASTSGRYQHLGVVEVASLVTATDGRDVIVDLNVVPGLDPDAVEHAVLRFTANVGVEGGSVTQLSFGSDDDAETELAIWGSPPRPDPGLGGSGVAVVLVDPDGRIRLRYRGGSVLNVDLVGYFTSDEAERSTLGLLSASAPRPLDDGYDRATGTGVDLVVGDISGGPTGGRVLVRPTPDIGGERLIFNLGADQRRVGPLWIGPASALRLEATTETTFWLIGSYQ